MDLLNSGDKPSLLSSLLLEDLHAQKIDSDIDFWPGMTIQEAAATSIRRSLVKKWLYSNTADADAAALRKFVAVNSRSRTWSLSELTTYDEMLLGGFKSAIWDFSFRRGVPLLDHPFSILSHGRVGPGAGLGSRGNDFYTKLFSGGLTASNTYLTYWYDAYIKRFPEWANAENIRRAHFGESSIRGSSRLSFVPKNDKISRCICIEPILNTFFQLGFGSILEARLRERFGISLQEQPFRNRDLACLGSITDGLSTIDLESASDSISLKMLEWALPRYLYEFILKLRCPVVDIPSHGTQELFMVSTMGNGFTFPLQTMIFSCVVAACLHLRGIPSDRRDSASSWGVFGDDIVCPSLITRDVIHLLHLLGFTVNSDKSFVEGPFRESCGEDYFRGQNIRGVYLKALSSPQDHFVAVNQLIRFSTRSGIFLWRLLDYILQNSNIHPVPPWENSDSGIHVPFSLVRHRLHPDKETQGKFYFASVIRSPKIRFTDYGSVVVPRHNKSRIYNPSGLHIAILQHSVNGMSIGTRFGPKKYVTKRRSTSRWDASISLTRDQQDYGLDWGRWNTFASNYLKRYLKS